MRRAQDRARSARSRKNGARSVTIESRALGALKLASEASCARSAQRECARQAGRFFSIKIWKKFENLSTITVKAMDKSDHVTKLYIYSFMRKMTFLIYKVSF